MVVIVVVAVAVAAAAAVAVALAAAAAALGRSPNWFTKRPKSSACFGSCNEGCSFTQLKQSVVVDLENQ